MNIKFGMDNFYVRYLKRFINHELEMPTALLGKFDKNDLKQIIKYLNLPNVKTMFEVEKEIKVKFPELRTLFTQQMKDDVITYTSRAIDNTTSTFMKENIKVIKEYCESVGWDILDEMDWIDITKDINNDGSVDMTDRNLLYDIISGTQVDPETYDRADLNLDGKVNDEDLILLDGYLNTGKLYFSIKKSNRKNFFPNKDMLVFINQFDGTFIQNYALRDDSTEGNDDIPHENKDHIYKLGIYECTPGQEITIAHNSSQPVHLIIGSSPANLKSNITDGNFMCRNVVEVTLKAGDYIQYTCASKTNIGEVDAHYVVIQCPSNYSGISGSKTKTLQLDTGDINFDGKIDMEDYHLLASYTALGPGSEKYHWDPTPKQLAVMNCRKDETDPNITVRDAEYLYRFIQGDPAIISLGFSYYDVTESADYNLEGNVENLLIIDGHYDDNVNIPFMEFVKDDWVIHEKFFNYLFGMATHKYSDGDNITYIQELLKEYYPEHFYSKNFFYPTRYDDNMRTIMYEYQRQNISYTIGDLNKDNRITTADLEILRNYINDSADYTLVQKFLTDPVTYPLSPEEILRLDQDGDGVLTDEDLKILDKALTTKYSELLRSRADINDDGFVDEADYIALKTIIEEGSYTYYDTKSQKMRTIDLKKYDIPFILGWCDVQTEAMLEREFNSYGLISEVSK